MITINPYLNFNGNCHEAFEFYKSVFGGEFPYVGRYKDMPADPEYPVTDDMKELIMHMSLPITKDNMLMGSDVAEAFGQKAHFGDNISLMISSQSKEEVDTIWAKLSDGATITMPLAEAFWGDYFGALTDKFGVNWMINCPIQK